ncbi:hypothetical protein N0V84_006176 [Fusarium piperis]|uniref:Uncharacterized protein n=1 Tax=Fusarium piperis TaxID=1435070 RepID=A0A9W8WCC1_9HYPO|nr:hypothetical protein N0V84_006176 [Fusarium piperis]
MAMAQKHTQASCANEFGEAGESFNGKQQEVSVKEELIPPTIRYQHSSNNDSTAGMYSLKLESATSSVESFHTSFTSPTNKDNNEGEDEDARSEQSPTCEGQYANQPMKHTYNTSQTGEDETLPRPGLDLPSIRAQTVEICSQSLMSNPAKEAESLNRVHRMQKSIIKSISRKLAKRKRH